jgi:cytochrome c peroxidase
MVAMVGAAAVVTADVDSAPYRGDGWYRATPRALQDLARAGRPRATADAQPGRQAAAARDLLEGRRLFEEETFGGNGRTCATCHSRHTGTVSPEDAQRRFRIDPLDPLFAHDGSDDEDGDGVGDGAGATRMLTDATVLMRIPLHPNVTLKHDPEARFVTVRRGIPTTINTPALDPVLMADGRQPTLELQALGAIVDHAQATRSVSARELDLIATFQRDTRRFFSSPGLYAFARGGDAPLLPPGRTASEKRGRTFFEDLPPDVSTIPPNFKPGLCATCHSGPMLNQTNQFLPLPLPPGTRFQTVFVSEINEAGNPPIDFVFHNQDVPGGVIEVSSPDPGRALVTGRADDSNPASPLSTFDNLNAFKISPLRGIRHTAPYFHDNSAKTLEDVMRHYRTFFAIASDLDGPGPLPPLVDLTEQDQRDIIAFMRRLD